MNKKTLSEIDPTFYSSAYDALNEFNFPVADAPIVRDATHADECAQPFGVSLATYIAVEALHFAHTEGEYASQHDAQYLALVKLLMMALRANPLQCDSQEIFAEIRAEVKSLVALETMAGGETQQIKTFLQGIGQSIIAGAS